MRKIKRRYVNTKKRLQYLRAKIKSDISKNGLSLDEETHGDIRSMMEEASESVGKSTNVFQKFFSGNNKSKLLVCQTEDK